MCDVRGVSTRASKGIFVYCLSTKRTDRLAKEFGGVCVEIFKPQQFLAGTVGFIVSLFVYVLVVRLPEQSKRRRVRASLIRQYTDFKHTCIMNFLFACNGSANMALRDALMDRKYFREFFKEPVSDSQDRWHAVLNGLDDYMVESLLQAMDLFGREVEYVVNAIEVRDPRTFESLRGVIQIIHGSRRWDNKDDQLKQLSQFLWQVHTGWNWVEGYTEKDFLADLVKAV